MIIRRGARLKMNPNGARPTLSSNCEAREAALTDVFADRKTMHAALANRARNKVSLAILSGAESMTTWPYSAAARRRRSPQAVPENNAEIWAGAGPATSTNRFSTFVGTTAAAR